jgi:hypothetical protein
MDGPCVDWRKAARKKRRRNFLTARAGYLPALILKEATTDSGSYPCIAGIVCDINQAAFGPARFSPRSRLTES